jgi:hypothetical protein
MSDKPDEDEAEEGRNNVVVKIGMVGDAQVGHSQTVAPDRYVSLRLTEDHSVCNV